MISVTNKLSLIKFTFLAAFYTQWGQSDSPANKVIDINGHQIFWFNYWKKIAIALFDNIFFSIFLIRVFQKSCKLIRWTQRLWRLILRLDPTTIQLVSPEAEYKPHIKVFKTGNEVQQLNSAIFIHHFKYCGHFTTGLMYKIIESWVGRSLSKDICSACFYSKLPCGFLIFAWTFAVRENLLLSKIYLSTLGTTDFASFCIGSNFSPYSFSL